MDLVQGLRSKSARYNSWLDIYKDIVSKIDKSHVVKKTKEKKDIDIPDQMIDWYNKCMNNTVREKILPKLKSRQGTKLTFEVVNLKDDFFDQNIEQYIRMIVMATLYNVTCDSKQNMYVSHYDHDTDIITAYPIEELLMASFYGLEIKGILFINKLNQEVLGMVYDDPIADKECQSKMFEDMDYSKLFGIPYSPDHDEPCDSDGKSETKTSKKSKGSKKMSSYPCCRYAVDLSGKVMEVCTEDTSEGSHHCFGCRSDFVKTINLNNVPVHQQMFDFNNFIININKTADSEYSVEFNDRQNPPYKHASYTDMGREEVVTVVTKTISKASWVTNMNVKIEKQPKCVTFIVKHVGIDWF